MLVLTRTVGEELVIGDDIRVRVSQIKGGRIKLAIDAPRNISIKREEAALEEETGGGSDQRPKENVAVGC